jgi:phthalate 4,5-dioxygenase oxygenase subunit
MLSKEENELVTRIGPGTPGGDLLRRYWQPAALAEELPVGGAPLPVRLMGEDLVLFRDEQGRPGLLGIHCSHRGADLSYGRLEDGGLRCIYHGWLYDVNGRCLEQPGEPAGSTFHERIRHPAYPCVETGGLILTYMGPGVPPLVPNYEFLHADETHVVASKAFQECNYLQGNEGNIDPAHHSFLHLRLDAPHDTQMDYYGQSRSPILETEETEFGVRMYAIRPINADQNFIKVTNFIYPNLAAITGDVDGYGVNWHVPIDDTHHWKYNLTFRRTRTVNARERGQGRTAETGYHPIRNKANRFLQDRESMKTKFFSGLGGDFLADDGCVTQGAGPIQDRTQEHMGYTDKTIAAARRALIRAIKAVQSGQEAPGVARDPAQNDFSGIRATKDIVPAEIGWYHYWEHEAAETKVLAAAR